MENLGKKSLALTAAEVLGGSTFRSWKNADFDSAHKNTLIPVASTSRIQAQTASLPIALSDIWFHKCNRSEILSFMSYFSVGKAWLEEE